MIPFSFIAGFFSAFFVCLFFSGFKKVAKFLRYQLPVSIPYEKYKNTKRDLTTQLEEQALPLKKQQNLILRESISELAAEVVVLAAKFEQANKSSTSEGKALGAIKKQKSIADESLIDRIFRLSQLSLDDTANSTHQAANINVQSDKKEKIKRAGQKDMKAYGAEVTKLCQLAGMPDKAAEFIARLNSVEEVLETLLEAKIELDAPQKSKT